MLTSASLSARSVIGWSRSEVKIRPSGLSYLGKLVACWIVTEERASCEIGRCVAVFTLQNIDESPRDTMDSQSQFFATFQTRLNRSENSSPTSSDEPFNEMAPPSATDDKTKRLTACLVCRKRKLKCDSARPKCASCARLGHAWYTNYHMIVNDSGYEETRKKSGPKQGYVKKLEQKSQTLEQRLAQLEKLLATHQGQQSTSPSVNSNTSHHLPTPPGISPLAFESLSAPGSTSTNNLNQFSFNSSPSSGINTNIFSAQQMFPDLTPPDSTNMNNLGAFPLFANDPSPAAQIPQESTSNPLDGQWAWDMISLGIQEELPPEELTNKL